MILSPGVATGSQSIRLVMLPGMDGTGQLFGPFLKALPPAISPQVIAYPPDRPLTYEQLEELAWQALPSGEAFALLGESYSGPIALRIAARKPTSLRAVVLAVSFAQPPRTKVAAIAARLGAGAFRVSPPDWLIRRLFLGPGAPAALVGEFKNVLRSVRPEVLATRLRDVLKVDALDALQECPYPLLAIAASDDRLVPGKIYQSMTALCCDMELTTLEGPHCLLLRNPGSVAEEVHRFLQRAFAQKA